MKYSVKIPSREALKYVSSGYFVIQNTAMAHVQVNAEGLHIKTGETIAISEFTDFCQKALDRGLIRVLGRPNESEPGKKSKKRNDEPAATPQQAPVSEPTPIEASENDDPVASVEESSEPAINTSDTINQDDADKQE